MVHSGGSVTSRTMKLFVKLPIAGVAAAVLMWTVLSLGERYTGAGRVRRVKINKSPELAAGDEMGGRGWWEEVRFAEYCRKRGWSDVELQVKTVVGDMLQKYVASSVGGEAPDLIALQPQEVAYWYDHGLLEPLDDFLVQWDAYQSGEINEEVVELCRGVTGELLCLSSSRHGPAMFAARRDWLERLGLPAPTTWAEAYEVWKAFTHDDPDGNGIDDTYGFVIDMKTANGEHMEGLQAFLFAAGVRWFRVGSDGKIDPAFNVPAAAQTLDFIKRSYKEGLFGKDVMYRTEEMGPVERFLSRKRGGMTSALFPNFYRGPALQYGMYDKVAIVPFLWKDDEAKRAGVYGTYTFLSGPWCLLRTCRDKESAWKFLEYWFSKDAMEQAYSRRGNGRERYIGRFGIYVSDVPWLALHKNVKIEVTMDPEIEALARPLDKYVVPVPYIASWSQISKAMAEVFVDFYLDKNYPTAQAALDEAQRRFREIQRAYEQELGPSRTGGSRS